MSEKENRTRSIKIRLTPFELDELKNLIQENSAKNLSDFIRQVIFTGKFKTTKEQQNYERLLYEVNKIGNNINQIAKLCNIQGKVDIQVLEQLSKLEEELSILLEECEC